MTRNRAMSKALGKCRINKNLLRIDDVSSVSQR